MQQGITCKQLVEAAQPQKKNLQGPKLNDHESSSASVELSLEPSSELVHSLPLLVTISTNFLVVLADLAGICLLTAVDGSNTCRKLQKSSVLCSLESG